MATIKSYTDLEQSRKLTEILPLESADMRYGYIAPYEFSDRMYDGGYDDVPYPKDFLKKNPNFSEDEYDGEFPCWSLAALLDVIPFASIEESTIYGAKTWFCTSVPKNTEGFESNNCDNPVDACVEMILKLKEGKLI